VNTTAEVLALFAGQKVTVRTGKNVEIDCVVTEAKDTTRQYGDGAKMKRIQLTVVSTSAPRLARD
jgi:hypothetical protein